MKSMMILNCFPFRRRLHRSAKQDRPSRSSGQRVDSNNQTSAKVMPKLDPGNFVWWAREMDAWQEHGGWYSDVEHNEENLGPSLQRWFRIIDSVGIETIIQQLSAVGEGETIAEQFFDLVSRINFSEPVYGPILYEIMIRNPRRHDSFTIHRDSFPLFCDPTSMLRFLKPENCIITMMCLAALASPADPQKFRDLQAFKLGDDFDSTAEEPRPTLLDALTEVKDELTAASHDTMTLLLVDIRDEEMLLGTVNPEEPANVWRPCHGFVIAADKSGGRIYQSFLHRDQSYHLREWIESSDADLRTWDDLLQWAEEFASVVKPAPEFNAQINAAWFRHFGVDILSDARAGLITILEPYNVVLRMHKVPNVCLRDLRKFEFDLDTYKRQKTKAMVEGVMAYAGRVEASRRHEA